MNQCLSNIATRQRFVGSFIVIAVSVAALWDRTEQPHPHLQTFIKIIMSDNITK